MICLAVNTANSVMSVAIIRDEGTVLYRFLTSETRDQGNLLIGHIDSGLKIANLTYDDIDLLAVVTGPGSFTGIRIGISAMRGFALAMQKPLVGISSFELFAKKEDNRTNLIAIESFRDELYLSTDAQPPVNLVPERFTAGLDMSVAYLVSGDAADKMKDFMPENSVFSEHRPDAVDVAKLAIAKFKGNKTGVFSKPEPFYLREADVSASTKIKPVKIV